MLEAIALTMVFVAYHQLETALAVAHTVIWTAGRTVHYV